MRERTLPGRIRVLSLTLLFAVLFSGTAWAAFSDVRTDHWAAGVIQTMSDRGVVGGYPDGSFKPNSTVNQVDAICMTVRAMGLQASSSGTLPQVSFPIPEYAENEVKLALQHGLIQNADQFSAYSVANRAWVARLLVRMIGKEAEAREELLMPSFTDTYIIPDWAVYYVRVAKDNDLIAGYSDNSFKPGNGVTRAEMVSFLTRAASKLTGTTGITGTTGTTITGGGVQQASGNVSGLAVKVYPEIGAFVVEEPGGNLRTLYLPGEASVSVVGSSAQGLSALQPGDEVSVALDAQGYILSIEVKSRGGYSGTEGIVFDLDRENELLTLQLSDNRLQPYRLAGSVNVIVQGVRLSSLSDIAKGDRVRVTVEDDEVIDIEVLEVASQLTVTGKIVTINMEKSFINLEVAGKLQVYTMPADVQVSISGMSRAYVSDLLEGDTVSATINSGEIASITVSGRQADSDFTATVMAVDTKNERVTLKDRTGTLKIYDVLSTARIVVDDDDDAELSDLDTDIDVKIRLLKGDIIYLQTDNKINGIITSIDADGFIMEFQRDSGDRKTYLITKSADVNSRDDRNDLDEIKRGDYASLVLSGDKVIEIDLRHTGIYRVETVRDIVDRLEVTDEDGDSERLTIKSGVELIIPGIASPDVDDVKKGDVVRAVFSGDDLESVEVLNALHGQVTLLDSVRNTVSLKLFNGSTTTVSFGGGSLVKKGGKTYTALSALAVGNRVEVVENGKGRYAFSVMEKVSGKLAFSVKADDDTIYLAKGNSWQRYNLNSDAYIHYTSGNTLAKSSLNSGYSVTLHMLWDMIYEIDVENPF